MDQLIASCHVSSMEHGTPKGGATPKGARALGAGPRLAEKEGVAPPFGVTPRVTQAMAKSAIVY
jgi:hypothetical protein